jgi:F-type H+-transporting ATPase subunit gamma
MAAAALQRAEQNIGTLSANLNQTLQRLRQSAIAEELFDVITGFNAPSAKTGVLR